MLAGGATLALAALILGQFWFGYAFPRHQQNHIEQIEYKALQVARLFESIVGHDAMITGVMPAASSRLLENGREKAGIHKLRVFDSAGVIMHSTDPSEIGNVNTHDYFWNEVAVGNHFSRLVKTDDSTLERDQMDQDVIETYVPVMDEDLFIGAFKVYLDAAKDLQALEQVTTDLTIKFLFVALLLMLLFAALVRHGFRVALLSEREQNERLHDEIEHRRRVEQELRDNERRFDHMAHHDSLTGLPNRRLFTAHLDHALVNAQREGTRLAVMFLDLDRFKTVNDSLGHETGDKLLMEVTRRLAEAVRQSDTLARMGGDEFAVIIERFEDELVISNLAERMLQQLELPVRIGDFELKAGASIGIALAFSDGATSDQLLKNADTAMYRAKESGRGRFEYYMPELNARAQVRLLLQSSIAHAIDRDELELYYQPQVSLADGSLHGAEALLRWNHRELGTLSPEEFIPIAEQSGLIVRIGEWVLREACHQARSWIDMGHGNFKVAVNLSARQFLDEGLMDKVRSALASSGLPARCLELELTESLIMSHPEQSISLLHQFHELGISTSIDDFGTGYSSLNCLSKFPIHRVKIDPGCVRDIDRSDDARIVATIINLAHGLELEVVAEGIEEAAQLDFLCRRGCALGQGYMFSPPVPAEAFTRLFIDRPQDQLDTLGTAVPGFVGAT